MLAKIINSKRIFQYDDDAVATLIRVTLGIVMFPHGAQKMIGWFGGYGFTGTMGFFTESMGIPWIFAFAAIATEFFGSIALITGFLSRLSALGIGSVMVVAILTSHIGNGFFMNWTGAQAGEGFEYHLLVLAMSIAIIIKGGGKWSLDEILSKK